MPRRTRNDFSLLLLLCVAALCLASFIRWRQHRPLSTRLSVLQFRLAESLMNRWAGEPQQHHVLSPWLDSAAKLPRYQASNRALTASPPPAKGRIVLYGDSLID